MEEGTLGGLGTGVEARRRRLIGESALHKLWESATLGTLVEVACIILPEEVGHHARGEAQNGINDSENGEHTGR